VVLHVSAIILNQPTKNDTPIIQVQNLTKRFGARTILSGVSLAVRPGEVAAIIGPSGGGKSTLLRCLNGLETFDDGQIDVAGTTLRPRIPHGQLQPLLRQIRLRVGMVFQQFNLFPHRSALGNVMEAPLHVLRQPRAAAEAEARTLLERVGLADHCDQMPDTLSGGQQQRVAIARALAMHPAILLFDEPTSALDPRMAAEVEAVIADLASSGQTMVVVTHSMQLARQTAQTVHRMESGRIIASGPAAKILRD
jgi:ABC-type polar amino acid transport system ATPase subunit